MLARLFQFSTKVVSSEEIREYFKILNNLNTMKCFAIVELLVNYDNIMTFLVNFDEL